jgi:hypothetical protein
MEGFTIVAEEKTVGPAATLIPSLAGKRRRASRMLLYIGTAILILLLTVTDAAVILHLRESELLDAEGQLKTVSLILAEQADRSFESVSLVLSSVAERLAAEGVTDSASFGEKMAGQDTYRLLRDKMTGVPQLDAVNLIGPDGDMINSSRSWPHPEVHIADRDFFKTVKTDPR